MSIKLFVSDLDGTLLPSGQTVSPRNIKAIQDMVKAGVIFTIATGRMFSASVKIAQSLGVDVPIITYNGALIKSTSGEVFHTDFLPSDLITEIIAFCKDRDWHIQNYSNDNLYFAEHNELAMAYENALGIRGEAIGWEAMLKMTENVPKLLSIASSVDETKRNIKILKDEFGDRVNATSSAPTYIEITCPAVSKAAAIAILASKFNINNSEIMSIGDSYNDLPMLKAVGHSVAMGNAPDDIKSACEFVTDDCNEDGFAQAVYKYVLTD